MGDGANLLFLTPVVPERAGNGLAMRAALFLEALSQDFKVYLQLIPVFGDADPDSLPQFVKDRTAARHVLNLGPHLDPHFELIDRLIEGAERQAALIAYPRPFLSRFATSVAIGEAARAYADISFELVHVMRLYMAPFATPYLTEDANAPMVSLDVDDNEVQTHERLSGLLDSNGLKDAGALEAAEAQKYRQLEDSYLSKFATVLVCSARDRDSLKECNDLRRIDIIPNAVARAAAAKKLTGEPANILMVGTMGYYPNEDAALFFCADVLPKLIQESKPNVKLTIVGSNPSGSVRRLEAEPHVTVTGTVPDVAPWYRSADLIVVPLRAGGGTRIKILEAFAHGVPVVSTTLGAEGLDVVDGEHLLLADTPEEFASCCRRVLDDPILAERLVDAAKILFDEKYATPIVSQRISDLYRDLIG